MLRNILKKKKPSKIDDSISNIKYINNIISDSNESLIKVGNEMKI